VKTRNYLRQVTQCRFRMMRRAGYLCLEYHPSNVLHANVRIKANPGSGVCSKFQPSVDTNLSSNHLQKSHAPARFICADCERGFKLEKDLRRHHLTHEPGTKFDCVCTKTYTRKDGLQRHISQMALSPREAGRHKAVESSQR
jgi:hypothetical protein